MTNIEEIDRDQAWEPSIIIEGIQYVQSARIPPQKIYIHPFTLSKIIKERNVILVRGGNPDPLSEEEQRVVNRLSELDRNEGRILKSSKQSLEQGAKE